MNLNWDWTWMCISFLPGPKNRLPKINTPITKAMIGASPGDEIAVAALKIAASAAVIAAQGAARDPKDSAVSAVQDRVARVVPAVNGAGEIAARVVAARRVAAFAKARRGSR